MRETLLSKSSMLRSDAEMQRYHFRSSAPVGPSKSRPKWMIPVALVTVVGSLIALANVRVVEPKAPEREAIDASRVSTARQGIASDDQSLPAVETRGSDDAQVVIANFDHCGTIRRTCVVDGDTFWLDGEKIRIADIDTPEISQPQCAYEKDLGLQATDRLIALLNAGPFELHAIGNRDTDRYGRKLRVVVRNGSSLGDQLVAEGLARTWTGRREPWC